jgi:hypothetical protein
MTTRYTYQRERAHDWRVYTLAPSGSPADCVFLGSTKAACIAFIRRKHHQGNPTQTP